MSPGGSPDFSPARLLNRYQLDELLAAGGFGEVWRAADLLLGRPVAVKLLRAGYARHPEALARFRAEARHAGSLSHENIARIYDYGEPADDRDPAGSGPPAGSRPPAGYGEPAGHGEPSDDGSPAGTRAPFLVMELVEGPSLGAMLADGVGTLDPVQVTDIVAQTAAGLDAAHRAGLVHRDIKPGNLLLSPDGLVKITDFGISYAAGSAPVTSTGQLVGTPGYLAPERASGARAGPASDLYSLGIVAWECLAGTPPFIGTPVEVAVAHRDRPLPPLPAAVPAEVEALIAELTAKDPAARPETAGQVARQARLLRDHLEAGDAPRASGPGHVPAAIMELDGLPAAAPAPAPRPPAGICPRGARGTRGARRVRRSAVAAVAAVAILAGLVLAGVLTQFAPAHRQATLRSGASTPPAALTVEVSGSSLVGRPVSAVVTQLRQLGLRVHVRWRPAARWPPGTVLSVQPAGLLRLGSLVTVTASLGPHRTLAAPRNGARPAAHAPHGHGPPGAGPGASGGPAPPASTTAPPSGPPPSGPHSSAPPSSGSPGTGSPGTGSPSPPATPAPPGIPAPPATPPPSSAPAPPAA